MNKLINLGKSWILQHKTKTLAIFAILLLSLSSPLVMMAAKGYETYGQNQNPGITTLPATVPGEVVQFGGGIEIVQPTEAQLAYYNVAAVYPDLECTAAPKTIGLGQSEQIIFGLWNIPPVVTGSANGISTGSYGGWGAFQVVVKDPDGTTVVDIHPPSSNATASEVLTATSGSNLLAYAPTKTGVYTVDVNWLGELVSNCTLTTMPNWDCYFKPMSVTLNFTVQQNPVPGFPEAAPPTRTQFWNMPISAENRGWSSVSGPWLAPSYNATAKFNPYTYAPDSAHILWQESLGPCIGGHVGGDFGPEDFMYWQQWSNMYPASGFAAAPLSSLGESSVVVMNGYMYCNDLMSLPANNASQIICRNILTGEILWKVPGAFNAAQILNFINVNIKYPIPMLWLLSGTTWSCYEANTGLPMFYVTGAQSPNAMNEIVNGPVYPQASTTVGYDGGGDLFVYTTGTNSYSNATWLCKWSANTFFQVTSHSGSGFSWPGQAANQAWLGKSYPWANGIMYNTTAVPYPGAAYREVGVASNGDPTILFEVSSSGARTSTNPAAPAHPWTTYMWAVNQTDGKLLWSSSVEAPPFSDMGTQIGYLQQCQAGYFTVWCADNGSVIGFDETTGKQAWITQITKNTYANIGINQNYGFENQIATVGYGNLYICLEDGYCHCVNMTTGEETWATPTQEGGLIGMTQPNYPIAANDGYMDMPCLADHKVFFTTGKEHEVNPYYQGHVLYCLDADTGVQLWNATGRWGVEAIANGILLGVNPYIGCLSAMARGQTLTTISAPQTQVTAGDQIVIQGTITDLSPALKGTPCMADSCMTQWMAYMLYDQPFPANAQGVEIAINAIDPNDNWVSIGNATSDSSGLYHYTWTPQDIPGTYTLFATMNPTNSYYGSSAETSAVVISPPTTTAPTTTPTSVADTYFMPAISGLIVVVIVGFAVLALLMLRKKP